MTIPQPRPFGWEDFRQEVIQDVAKQMAATAVTAPKSGGRLFNKGAPPFLETVIVNDQATLQALAGWMRQWGTAQKPKDDYWERDARTAGKLDAALFIGLDGAYPPNYDCGACGYATCAEFLVARREIYALSQNEERFEFAGPQCPIRAVDLGIAIGSAAKLSALLGIDCRCQTRLATAARKLGLIRSELAVALSLSATHKHVGFDIPKETVKAEDEKGA